MENSCCTDKLRPRANHKACSPLLLGITLVSYCFLRCTYSSRDDYLAPPACFLEYSYLYTASRFLCCLHSGEQVESGELIKAAVVKQRTMQSVRIGFVVMLYLVPGREERVEGNIEQLKPQNWGNGHISVVQQLLRDQQSKGNQL